MRRRDTIIIAVLVNAGLLLVLFATAMRSNKKEEKKELAQAPAKEETLVQATKAEEETLATAELAEQKDPLAETLNDADPLAFGDEMDIPLAPTAIESAPVVPVPSQAPAPVAIAPTQAPAPAAAVQPEKKEVTMLSVTVKKGDALEKIARAHHSSVNAIMKANNMTNANLKIGQVLKVPTNTVAKKETPAAPQSGAKKAGDGEFYVVKEGDNPWLIASRNHVKLDELLKMNGMDEAKARKLKPGDKLRIR